MPNQKQLHQPKQMTLLNYFSIIPFFLKLLFGYCIILVSALPFYFGYQIFPINNYYNDDDMNPECLMINKLGYINRGNYLNLTYSLNSNIEISKNIAPNLFRIKMNGSYFSEELRHQNIKGFFKFQNNAYGISYELHQEGEVNISLQCLDRILMNTTQINITNINPQLSSYTIFHQNSSLSNICHYNDNTIIFVPNNLRHFTSQTLNLHSFQYQNTTISEFEKNNNNFIDISYPFIDIHRKTYFQIISEILPFAYYHFQNKLSITINSDEEEKKKFYSLFDYYFPNSISFTEKPIHAYCYPKTPISMIKHQAALNDQHHFELYKRFIDFTISQNHKEEDNDVVIDSTYNLSFHNFDEMVSKVKENLKSTYINLSNLPFQRKVSLISNSKAMIQFDDSNEIVDAIWMKPGSKLIVLKNSERSKSEVLSFVQAFGIQIEIINCGRYQNGDQFNIPINQVEDIINKL